MSMQTLMDMYIGQPHLEKINKVANIEPSQLHFVKKANLITFVICYNSYIDKLELRRKRRMLLNSYKLELHRKLA